MDAGTAALTIVNTDGKKIKRCKAKKAELSNKRRREIFSRRADSGASLSETSAPYYSRGEVGCRDRHAQAVNVFYLLFYS